MGKTAPEDDRVPGADAQIIVENSGTVLFRVAASAAMPLLYISRNVSRYGYSASELLQAPRLDRGLIHPADLGALRDVFAGACDTGRHDLRLRKRDGSYAWFDAVIRAVRNQAGERVAFEGLLHEITGRKDAETRLASADAVLAASLENVPEGVVAVDSAGQVKAFNRRFANLFGFSSRMMRMGYDDLIQALTSNMRDEKTFLDQVRDLAGHPRRGRDDALELKDGRFLDYHVAPLFDAERHYLGRALYFRDVTEHKRAERKHHRPARTDSLTGLANRSLFLDRLSAAFAAMTRGGDVFAVLHLDVDRFKDVNDTLGQLAGDALLRAVGKRILETVREADLVARLGGDEFAVLQADLGDIANAGTLAKKMRAALAMPYTIEGSEVHITASIGISFYRAEAGGPGALLAEAGAALRRAKQAGRDQYRLHSGERGKAMPEPAAIIARRHPSA